MQCSKFRRLGAIFYDALLNFALLLLAAAIPTTFAPTFQTQYPMLFQLYLLLTLWAYYGYCVTRSGQTLGAKAWHIKILTLTGTRLSWKMASLRFGYALLGYGSGINLLWWIWDTKGQLQDRLSQTMCCHTPQ